MRSDIFIPTKCLQICYLKSGIVTYKPLFVVYTVWKKPNLMLQFTTWPLVFEKLQGGAGIV